MVDKCLLQRMERARTGKPFYREHLCALDILDRGGARAHGLAADNHGTCAAVAFPAPVLCARETEFPAQQPQHAAVVVDVEGDRLVVQIKSDRALHRASGRKARCEAEATRQTIKRAGTSALDMRQTRVNPRLGTERMILATRRAARYLPSDCLHAPAARQP